MNKFWVTQTRRATNYAATASKISRLSRPLLRLRHTRPPLIRLCVANSKAPLDTATQLNKQFAALTAGSYAAKVKVTKGPAGLGLVATAPISSHEVVFMIPECNSLTVPEGSTAYAWERKWLEPFERRHGQLPPALAYYLSDREAPALPRLASLILYVRKHASGKMWKAWNSLLPSLDAATYPGGPWTNVELKQLQLAQLELLLSDNCDYYKAQAKQLFVFLTQDPDNLGLKQLQLADTVDDCLWAQFVAATRGSDAGTDDSSLHPVHDLLNHSETPNCTAGVSTDQDGFLVQANTDIQSGTELTICYAKANCLSSIEMLLSWGFTPDTRPTDWVFCQHVHALPPIPWQPAVAAAQTLMSTSSGGGNSRRPQPSHLGLGMLLAVIGSLPLQLPISGSSSGSSPAAKPQPVAVSYAHGAEMLLKYGTREGEDDDAFLLGQPGVALIAAERFKAPNSQLRLALQDAFMQDVLETASSSSSAGGIEQQQQLLLDGPQFACAVALANECKLRLLDCTTTIEQDEQLLPKLYQQEAAAEAAATTVPGKAKGFGKPVISLKKTKRVAAITAAAAEAAARPMFAAVEAAADSSVTVSGVLDSRTSDAGTTQTSSKSGTKQASSAVMTQVVVAELHSQEQLVRLQQQVLGHLLVLQANTIIEFSSSSNSDIEAAHRVIAAVQQQHQHPIPPNLSAQHRLQIISECQKQQGRILQQVQQQQQQFDVDAHLAHLLCQSGMSAARLATAVAARLEHKKLLQLCAALCGELTAAIE